MKTLLKAYLNSLVIISIGLFSSCSKIEIPNHELGVEFKYELTCSESLLKYVTPEVTITDGVGNKLVITISDGMWKGSDHKTWEYIVHYDSLNVSSLATVRYILKEGVIYEDESEFESVHNLSCFISIQEDEDGRRNNHTIIPETPSQKANVTADVLKDFIDKLSSSSITRGGSVDMNGEITKIESEN